ncbi:phosphotransferase family protein [Amycolatopsis sp. FDAARGOS 1241]|uniref:phosphotransferase family protein n=1 Tax=Amycolatopsis sp. FDAARGOS 1241 TaxID=2778070 RepID=UPI00194E87F8|nr:phosphotransferase family protein [Amycolatopsis sp. FDAARGOS 1241]QRP43193.1 phosphotransferase family protein [Amycolatopsis sp. FDAARGOS 1241]
MIDLARLRALLTEHGVAITGDLRADEISGGRSNLTYKVSDDVQAWVVRRPPVAGLTPSAHDVLREYRIVDALQATDIPVAPTVLADETGPLIVVGFVPGRVLRTRADLDGVDVADVHRELIRVLVALHAVPYAEIGLGDFGRPDGFFARQVKRWRRQWDHVATRELPDLDRLYARLTDRTPPPAPATIVHGDYRVDNTLLDPARPSHMLALVDWEMSTLGDPLTDVATMCTYQHPAFDHVVGEPAASTSPRWPGPDVLAQDYATASGRDLGEFSTYLGLAYFKLAVIAEGIRARYLAGAGSEPGHASAGEAVPGLVAEGLAVLGR